MKLNNHKRHEIFCVVCVYESILVIFEGRVVGNPLLPIFLFTPSCSLFILLLLPAVPSSFFVFFYSHFSSSIYLHVWSFKKWGGWLHWKAFLLFDFLQKASSTCTLNLILCKFLFFTFPFNARSYLFHCVEIIFGIMVSLLWL